ncbi:MAG: hypothetical protein AB7I38_18745 [Dehalococcoidia bacterium]|jgi:hypothetical protein
MDVDEIIRCGGPDLAVAFAALAIDPQDPADAGDRDLVTSIARRRAEVVAGAACDPAPDRPRLRLVE